MCLLTAGCKCKVNEIHKAAKQIWVNKIKKKHYKWNESQKNGQVIKWPDGNRLNCVSENSNKAETD